MSEPLSAGDERLVELVRSARPHVERDGPDTEAWLDRLEDEHDALHDLTMRLLVADPAIASAVAASIWAFWWLRAHMEEGRQLLQQVATIESPHQADVLKGLGTIAFRQGDLDAAERAFASRLSTMESSGDREALADAFADLARIALRRGDFAGVRRYAEQGYTAAEGLDPAAIRMPLHMRAAAARMEGRLDDARALYLESRALNERLGKELNVAGEDHNLVYVALHSGDLAEARRRFRDASRWIFSHNNAYLLPYAFLDAGVLALHDGEIDRACLLVACANRIFEDTDSIPDPDDYVELDAATARLKRDLGERFDSLWADGRELSHTAAQALAQS